MNEIDLIPEEYRIKRLFISWLKRAGVMLGLIVAIILTACVVVNNRKFFSVSSVVKCFLVFNCQELYKKLIFNTAQQI